MAPTRAELLTKDLDIQALKTTIAAQSEGKGFKIRELLASTQSKLENADGALTKAESLTEPLKSKSFVSALLAPAKEVVNLLDAVSDIHPAVKVVAGVVKIVVKLEIDRHENDKQIAIVFFTMSSLLTLLASLDSVFEDEKSGLHSLLSTHMDKMCATIKDFGNFAEVYYRHKHTIIRTLKSGKYKAKLSGYAGEFEEHKKELQLLLTSHSVLSMQHFRSTYHTDMQKISNFIDMVSSRQEKYNEEIVRQMGGADRISQDDRLIDELSKRLKENVDSATRRVIKSDLDEVLAANADLYELKLERGLQKLHEAITYSTETIIAKMEAGPHEFIDDPDIKIVWRDMRASTSTKVRVFLDAVYHHFSRQFALEEFRTGNPHPDRWTLNFLSKVIFYPSMGDAIDDDCSGFVSVQEVDKFLKSRPEGWSVPQWIAFWAAGPYLNDVDYQAKIQKYLDELRETIGDPIATSKKGPVPAGRKKELLEPNKKRVRYFVRGIGSRLKMISIYTGLLDFYDGSMHNEEIYANVAKLRNQWRTTQEEEILRNLERSKYRFQSEEAVSLIVGTPRIEQYLLCVVYMLLQRHVKIVDLAREQLVAVAEFEDMRDTWEHLFDAFETRMYTLNELWRQQRRDLKVQAECYAAGLFEEWYEMFGDDDSDLDGYDSDTDSWISDEGNEADATATDADEVLSQIPSARPGKTLDPAELLSHPVPAEPENDADLTTDEDSDWESPEVKRKKAEKAMMQRVKKMEKKLNTVESMLRQLLTAQGIKIEEPPASKNGSEDGSDSGNGSESE